MARTTARKSVMPKSQKGKGAVAPRPATRNSRTATKPASRPTLVPNPTAPVAEQPQVTEMKGTKMQRTRTLLVRNHAQRQGKKCINLLIDTMDNREVDVRVRVQCALALLDRGFGKAPQAIEHSGENGGPIRAVIELPPNFRREDDPDIIDVTPGAPLPVRRERFIEAAVVPQDDDEVLFDDDDEDFQDDDK